MGKSVLFTAAFESRQILSTPNQQQKTKTCKMPVYKVRLQYFNDLHRIEIDSEKPVKEFIDLAVEKTGVPEDMLGFKIPRYGKLASGVAAWSDFEKPVPFSDNMKID